ncbi:excinuclease ABC subunit UvrC [Desulfohalobium retbaense]|uniref:UvrABC system protein C n=1 Tax=Desulfohalobium retbaense (strain ATCC 49708 / DSM 5692 / JCM 16813 / HR100) TaxID=485915 RepID=C8X3R4_DESRD|nr:excinuclease ABC subunit UvrC [Desulfohalobium retbaense]ACV69061.1 excinuclease ABC, C subunit [Desulfohalobium retbaense DSM 5692]
MKPFRAKEYPDCPGTYLMKDERGRVIYVGKAKVLRKRLASYFQEPDRLPRKTRVMMDKVWSIETLCTETEKEAFLLENSLIKKHRPRYNIILRDDKSYVLFKLDKRHPFPRLSMTRRVVQDGSTYFGPFTSAVAARETWKLLNRLFPLRKCKQTTFNNRVRPCLQYNIGRCLGPCVYDIPRQEYQEVVRQVELFLTGRSKELLRRLRADMQAASEDLRFEDAARLRDQIQAVEQTVEQQVAVLPGGKDRDVLGLGRTVGGVALGLLFVRQGQLLDQKSFFWAEEDGTDELGLQEETASAQSTAVEEAQEVLRSFVLQFYSPGRYIPERIVLPFAMEDAVLEDILSERRGGPVRLATAHGPQERKLVSLAETNAVQAGDRARKTVEPPLERLQDRLGLSQLPERIEAVDASHFGGQGMVVGQVVFENGRPHKEAYRIYAFPELEGAADDYAALQGWARRRLRSGPPWPDLIVVDGGKGQLQAVQKGLNEGQEAGLAADSFALAALAKGERRGGELEERVFRPGRKNPVALRPGSAELLLLQHIRDSVHRFVLSRQRRTRRAKGLDSRLEELPGVGPRTAHLLWNHFGTLERMCQATEAELEALPGIGAAKAAQLRRGLASLSPGTPVDHDEQGGNTA